MTDLTSAQLTALTALLLGTEPARAATKEKALSRLVATAEGHGLKGLKKILGMAFEDARAVIEDHAAGRSVHDDMEAAAEALTRPRKRRPVLPAPATTAAAQTRPRAKDTGKAWFRNGDIAEARMLAVMIEAGPNKLAVFRGKFAEGQDAKDEWDALSQTQQNGILIRAMDKLMAAGKLTRDGLIYGVKEEFSPTA